jgi:CheY-like chemotaxis protein
MAKQKKILVADDNDGIVASLTMALQYGGYEVTSIMNGEEVKKISAPFPDLILLDIWMAGVNGLDVCRHLKAQRITKHIPIVMISAYPDASASALEAGANDFMEKPYTIQDMLTIVGKHVD